MAAKSPENQQPPTAVPVLSVSTTASQGTISGKIPKILIFDDMMEDPFGEGQCLPAYVEFFNNKGYEAIGVRVVNYQDLIGENCKATVPKDGVPYCAHTQDDVRYLLKTEKPDIVLTDGQWSNKNIFSSIPTNGGIGGGVALADMVREYDPAIPCVLHTGTRSHNGIVAEQMGDREYMVAPKKKGQLPKIKEYFDTKLAQGKRIE